MDYAITKAIASIRTSLGIKIAKIISHSAILLSTTIAISLLQKNKKKRPFPALAVIISFILSELLKIIIKRPRPVFATTKTITYSMPSSHATVAFALVPFAFKINKKAGISILITAILISFSRMYQGFHYLSDVLAGALLGTAISFLILKLTKEKQK